MKKTLKAGKAKAGKSENLTITKNRRVRFEFLEQREMLAGDVKAAVSAGGILTLTGDFQDNSIVVTQVSPNRFSVQPLAFNGATSVNGSNSTFITPVGKTITGVTINMDGGNDRVVLKNMSILGDLKIQLDGGKASGQTDSLTMQNVSVDGATTVNSGNGNDSITISNCSFDVGGSGTDLKISTGTGRDTVRIQGSKFTNDLKVGTGGENDTVIISGVQVGHNATVTTAGGNAQISFTHSSVGQSGKKSTDTLLLDAEDGANATIQVADINANFLTVDTGTGKSKVTIDRVTVQKDMNFEAVGSSPGDPNSGDDSLKITNSGFGGDLIIDTGAGDDSVTLDNVSVTGGLYLFTQDGSDKVSINRLGAGLAKIDLFSENDSMLICNSIIADLTANGGSGTDSLTLSHNVFGSIATLGFETQTTKPGSGPIGPGKP